MENLTNIDLGDWALACGIFAVLLLAFYLAFVRGDYY